VPHQIDGEIEVRVLDMRKRHHLWGPKRIQFELKKAAFDPPSHMAIYRALLRSGLVVKGERKKVLKTYKRWERGRPMELWQMDVVGSIFTTDGTEAKIFTGIDDHSRFLVCRGVMAKATAGLVCEHFVAALTRWGVPEEILTENGKVLTGRFGRNDSEVLFDKICRENGIKHILTQPRSSTTTGKIERSHYTLRREVCPGSSAPGWRRPSGTPCVSGLVSCGFRRVSQNYGFGECCLPAQQRSPRRWFCRARCGRLQLVGYFSP
jgi:transposase InsO family protein